MNKKILVTVILAAILALISAFLLFYNTKKVNQTGEKQLSQEIKTEKKPLTDENNNLKLKEDSKKDKNEHSAPQSLSSPQITIKKNTQEKQSSIPKNIEQINIPALPKLEVKIEENSPEEINPKDFTVPVQYKSENTYKYVYTPTRYSK